MDTQFSHHGDIVEHFEAYDDILDWFMEVKLINKKNKLKKEDEKIYYEEIINFRTLLRSEFKQFIESQISIDNLISKINNILYENQVHPKIVPVETNFELQYIFNTKKNNYLLPIFNKFGIPGFAPRYFFLKNQTKNNPIVRIKIQPIVFPVLLSSIVSQSPIQQTTN